MDQLGHLPIIDQFLVRLIVWFSQYIGLPHAIHVVGLLSYTAVQAYMKDTKTLVVSDALRSLLSLTHTAVTDKEKLDALLALPGRFILQALLSLKRATI